LSVERSLSASADDLVKRVVTAGSAVSFNCTLVDSCVNRSIVWKHYSASDTTSSFLYLRGTLHPKLQSRGVTVEENSARGWSVLSIPNVSLRNDHGRFRCYQSGVKNCEMNFQLTVTGRHTICKLTH